MINRQGQPTVDGVENMLVPVEYQRDFGATTGDALPDIRLLDGEGLGPQRSFETF